MQNIPFPQLVGPTYSMASLNADCQRCVNLQLEAIESGEGANQFYLRETPGLTVWLDLRTLFPLDFTNKQIQGMLYSSLYPNKLYVVCNNEFLTIDTFTKTISPVTRQNLFNPNQTFYYPIVQINENSQGVFINIAKPAYRDPLTPKVIGLFSMSHTAIVAASQMIYSGSNPVQPVDFLGLYGVEFLNNRLITIALSVNAAGIAPSTYFQISPIAVAPGAAWNSAELYSVESSIDKVIAIKANGSELWCFGTNSYEIFIDVGGANLSVYKRISETSSNIGCASPDSVQSFNRHVFWLSSSNNGAGFVYMSNGYSAEKISTLPIDAIIREYISSAYTDYLFDVRINCISFVYSVSGHDVYMLSLIPNASSASTLPTRTIAYDMTTGQWSERGYWNLETSAFEMHRGLFAQNIGSVQLVSDTSYPIIYELSPTTYTDNGNPIVRYRRSPVLLTNNRRIFFKRLILNMEVGVGLEGQEAPIISVRWSNDNAHTFGNYHTASLGAIGKFLHQVVFNRLGSSLRRVFEVYYDAPTPFRIITAEVGISEGLH